MSKVSRQGNAPQRHTTGDLTNAHVNTGNSTILDSSGHRCEYPAYREPKVKGVFSAPAPSAPAAPGRKIADKKLYGNMFAVIGHAEKALRFRVANQSNRLCATTMDIFVRILCDTLTDLERTAIARCSEELSELWRGNPNYWGDQFAACTEELNLGVEQRSTLFNLAQVTLYRYEKGERCPPEKSIAKFVPLFYNLETQTLHAHWQPGQSSLNAGPRLPSGGPELSSATNALGLTTVAELLPDIDLNEFVRDGALPQRSAGAVVKLSKNNAGLDITAIIGYLRSLTPYGAADNSWLTSMSIYEKIHNGTIDEALEYTLEICAARLAMLWSQDSATALKMEEYFHSLKEEALNLSNEQLALLLRSNSAEISHYTGIRMVATGHQRKPRVISCKYLAPLFFDFTPMTAENGMPGAPRLREPYCSLPAFTNVRRDDDTAIGLAWNQRGLQETYNYSVVSANGIISIVHEDLAWSGVHYSTVTHRFCRANGEEIPLSPLKLLRHQSIFLACLWRQEKTTGKFLEILRKLRPQHAHSITHEHDRMIGEWLRVGGTPNIYSIRKIAHIFFDPLTRAPCAELAAYLQKFSVAEQVPTRKRGREDINLEEQPRTPPRLLTEDEPEKAPQDNSDDFFSELPGDPTDSDEVKIARFMTDLRNRGTVFAQRRD